MATQVQMIGNEILSTLKFEILPAKTPDGEIIYGGDQKFKATKESVEFVKQLLDDDQTLILNSEGKFLLDDVGETGAPDLPR